MNKSHESKLAVLIGNTRCGTLTEARTGSLEFKYDPDYCGIPLSVSMPVGLAAYGDRIVRPYLMGLLPDEEQTRAAIGAKYGISGDNPFRLLARIGRDCPGAVQVLAENDVSNLSDQGNLIELSDADVSRILSEIRESSASAWTDQDGLGGRWSLGGCQAKIALCCRDGHWFRCEGSSPSTHILKPGVAGMEHQALVEYLSMRTAAIAGLPVANASFKCFDGEWAIVVERYDRHYDGEAIERIHQEDFCQALSVSPLRKYADQGGPNTPQIITLLKETGARSRENVYRFALYLFFNYLIGATDAHAKNHSLVFPSAGEIRLAPLYDVASIAPYRSLSPRQRKPLRAALSIGGENRFGHVKSNDVEKMVANCELEELGLSADMLIDRFRTMAEVVPRAVAEAVDRAIGQGLPGAAEIGEPLKREISENCTRTLSNLT